MIQVRRVTRDSLDRFGIVQAKGRGIDWSDITDWMRREKGITKEETSTLISKIVCVNGV